MSYVDELKFFWRVMCDPAGHAKRKLDTGEALKLYYTVAVLPFIAYIVFGFIAVALGITVHSFGMHTWLYSLQPFVSSLSYFIVFASAIVLFFVALPLGIAIDALIYQIVGKIFLKAWKGTYEKTFTAIVFATFPLLLFLWLSLIPFLNSVFIIIAPLWSIVILVVALSSQQNITRMDAFLMMLIKSVLVVLVLTLLGLSVFASLSYVVSSLVPGSSITGPVSNATMGSWVPRWGT
jgi:hypothetical protein